MGLAACGWESEGVSSEFWVGIRRWFSTNAWSLTASGLPIPSLGCGLRKGLWTWSVTNRASTGSKVWKGSASWLVLSPRAEWISLGLPNGRDQFPNVTSPGVYALN